MFTKEYFMNLALQEAKNALEIDEVPIGCVVVCGDRVIAKSHNLCETLNDVTAHAEMQAITSAANHLGGKYLKDCTMYITLEPCTMCAGALYWAQISKVVIGASDEKRGYLSKNIDLHPKTIVEYGVLEDECRALIQSFFAKKRKQ